MKKIRLSALIFFAFCYINICAEARVTTDVDVANGHIVISGESDRVNETVTVQVFRSGRLLADFENSAEQASGYAVYVGQSVTDDRYAGHARSSFPLFRCL